MQPLTLLWGCLLIPGCRALMGPKEIRGFEGDTVSLQCTYEEELRTYKKYWCRRRGFLFSRCSGAIYVEGDGQERTEGRVSVQDRPRELTLKVTLRNLTLQDAGNYFCGVKKLGPDETFMVSLLIFPGPCCPPSPTPSFQPLATTSLQPKAKAWQTQPPGLRTSHPASPLDPTSAEDASVVSSSSSKSRVHVPMIRILAPVLVLLTLLLAAGLAALGSCVFRWRKEAQLATEAQRNKKVQLSHLVRKEAGWSHVQIPTGLEVLTSWAFRLGLPTWSAMADLKAGLASHLQGICMSPEISPSGCRPTEDPPPPGIPQVPGRAQSQDQHCLPILLLEPENIRAGSKGAFKITSSSLSLSLVQTPFQNTCGGEN